MHIALLGPISLDLLTDVESSVLPRGYPFPMTAHLANAYVKIGHKVTVITTSHEQSQPVDFRLSDSLSVIVVPSRSRARHRALDFFRSEREGLVRATKRAAPDVVHAHWTYEFALAAQASEYPSLITVHDWAPAILKQITDPYRAIRLLMQVAVLSHAEMVSAPSEYIAERVRKWYRKPCVVVHNGIDTNKFVAQRFKHQSNRKIVIGMLNASADPRKNIWTALQSWKLLSAHIKDAELRIGGSDFEPSGDFAKKAATLGLDSGVKFCGNIPPHQVPNWMQELDLFLHPSLEESFGLVLLEALAAGAKVVAGKNSGAVSEVVGEFAALADVTSPQAICDTVLAEVARTIGQTENHDRCRHVRAYDINSIAEKYEALLSASVAEAVTRERSRAGGSHA